MSNETHPQPAGFPPCCPDLKKGEVCDTLDFHYRVVHNTTVATGDQRQNVAVEVIMHARLERCPGPLVLGDLVYSQTLFPGEKVRLFTADRRTRYTFDSATKVSYRAEQTQEEQFYLSSMSDFMSDVTVRDSSRATNQSKGSAHGHAGTSGAIQSFFGGASVDVSGSYSAESTSDFLRELSQHARSSHHASEQGTRAASAVSIGEVQTRTHTQAESQDHFESSSREFSNPNHCHAITFFFYRINKTQTVRFKLESIQRRVVDPAADTKVTKNPFVSRGEIATIPAGVLATSKDRLDIERIGRESVAAQETSAVPVGAGLAGARFGTPLLAAGFVARPVLEPLPAAVRQQALKQVDERLVAAKLLTAVGGQVSPEAQKQFSFEIHSSLPTPGMLVKGCLDECDVCEPELKREIEIDLERKKLENDRLKRQIELMEKDQEHRCCPAEAALTP
ncbi:MAG: hypothetical protein KGJ12_04005 [Gammaproteobacteria bacterium]|nr:hypothetical protein [Gammaproteobacteria bacterium]